MSANRIQIQTLALPKCFHITLDGVVNPADVVKRIAESYAEVDEPWQYDQLCDIRGMINVFSREDFAAISKIWTNVAANYRLLRVAIVTTDPFRMERKKDFAALFTNITAHIFPTVDAAFEWLSSDATTPAAITAGTGR